MRREVSRLESRQPTQPERTVEYPTGVTYVYERRSQHNMQPVEIR
ncbi:hypothetical protein [Mycobacterium neglectum]|jgi:hypothetical protein|nr:hypothetical protein [Mycobacterium neglectum]